MSPVCAICPAHLIFCDFITLTALCAAGVMNLEHWASHTAQMERQEMHTKFWLGISWKAVTWKTQEMGG